MSRDGDVGRMHELLIFLLHIRLQATLPSGVLDANEDKKLSCSHIPVTLHSIDLCVTVLLTEAVKVD